MKAYRAAFEYGSFDIWDEPTTKLRYIVGVDTSEGKQRDLGRLSRIAPGREEEPDYSAAVVIERETGKHVATWHGKIPTTDWGYTVAAIGNYYNKALLVPEINGPGIEVVNTLARRLRYAPLYVNKLFGQIDGDDFTDRWGWRTTVQTRPMLVARIEEMLGEGRVFTRDKRLLAELRTMEIDNTGVARARHPNHDDLAIAYGLALQGRFEALYNVQQTQQKPDDGLTDYERRIWDDRKRKAEHGSSTDRDGRRGDLQPFGSGVGRW